MSSSWAIHRPTELGAAAIQSIESPETQRKSRHTTMQEDKKELSPGDVAFGHVPDWIDAAFFERAITQGKSDTNLHVVDVDVQPAIGKGENYVSIVYRALVTEEGGKEHHLIVKCLPSNEVRRTMSNKGEFFRKEIDMYEVVFPLFRRMDGSRVGEDPPWPRTYVCFADGDRDYLVMDDLKPYGYVMRERRNGLDHHHLATALAAVAKFHAYSYALKLQDPETFKKKVYDLFPESLYNKQLSEMMDVFMERAYLDTSIVVREWGGPKYNMIADWMVKTKETAFEHMVCLLSPDDPGSVLNHGDFWVNNMLFKYSSPEETVNGTGKPTGIKLLDFQLSRVGSPAGDLVYLLATSVTADTRKQYWNDLLQNEYLRSFWETMEYLGSKDEVEEGLFTLEWIQSEILRYKQFAFACSITVTQAVLAESSAAPDMDSLTEEELKGNAKNPFQELAKGKYYQARLKELMEYFEEIGLFD